MALVVCTCGCAPTSHDVDAEELGACRGCACRQYTDAQKTIDDLRDALARVRAIAEAWHQGIGKYAPEDDGAHQAMLDIGSAVRS